MFMKSVLYLNLSIYLILMNSLILFINSFIWFWFILEICFMIYLMMLCNMEKNFFIIMIYFIIQFFSTMMILFGFLLGFEILNFLNLYFIQIGLLIKLGIMPFHNWFISMITNISWYNLYWLLTLQKFVPLWLFFFILPFNNNLLMVLLLLNFILSSLYSLKLKNLKIIFGYSSIYHTSWMLYNLLNMNYFLLFYFLIYMILIYSLFMYFDMNKFYKVMCFSNLSILNKLIFFFLIFSYSGFPPFSGFILKWMSTFGFLENKFDFFFLLIIFFCSFIFMFNYLKLFVTLNNLFSSKLKFMQIYKFKSTSMTIIFIYLSLFLFMMLIMILV